MMVIMSWSLGGVEPLGLCLQGEMFQEVPRAGGQYLPGD